MRDIKNTLIKATVCLHGFDCFFKTLDGDLLQVNDHFIYVNDNMDVNDNIIFKANTNSSPAKIIEEELIDGYVYYIANDDYDSDEGFDREFKEKIGSEDFNLMLFEGSNYEDFYRIENLKGV